MTMAVIRWPPAVYAARLGHQHRCGEQYGRNRRSFNEIIHWKSSLETCACKDWCGGVRLHPTQSKRIKISESVKQPLSREFSGHPCRSFYLLPAQVCVLPA